MGIIIINTEYGQTRVAVVRQGQLSELEYERTHHQTAAGNIYVGKVTRIIPGLQAAFVDIGQPRSAFLHVQDTSGILCSGDIHKGKNMLQPATALNRDIPIKQVLQQGQTILVQVVKDAMGTKGARLTSHVSLAGRYLIFAPDAQHVGVSRRIDSPEQRERLRRIVQQYGGEPGGWIVRTAADNVTQEKLEQDIDYLKRLWQQIQHKRNVVPKVPCIVFEELDLVLRTARDLMDDDTQKVVLDSAHDYERFVQFVRTFMPQYEERIELHKGTESAFDAYQIEKQIARALAPRVPLPSGGHLIVDETEALTAIDVNTGSFVGTDTTGAAAAVLATNLEAIDEIANQIRLRNLGGLIVLDLIDMNDPHDQQTVTSRLEERLKKDHAKVNIHPMSPLGLIEMTRQRSRDSLSRTLQERCFYCDGTGRVQSRFSMAIDVMQRIRTQSPYMQSSQIVVNAHPAVINVLRGEQHANVQQLETHTQKHIELLARENYHIEQFDLQEK